MRVVQVTPRYAPHAGGVETHVAELAIRLAERGHAVTVVSADAGGDVPRRETRDGVRVWRHRGLAPGGAFHVAPGVWRSVRSADADVVHAHNYHALPMLFAALGACDAAFVATPHYHGGSASPLRDRLLSVYRPLGRWALRRADARIAVSDWERRRLADDFAVDATVIPNGLDVARFADATPETRERPYLLCVGRLEAYKGVQHAIRALAEPDLAGYDLVVAGSGAYRDALEAVARDVGVAERVDFLGFVDDQRLPGLYAGADAFLALSSFEAYGMTVGEALAAGTPCVVREAGALVDWLSDRACVGVTDPTPDAVADAVGRVRGRTPEGDRLLSWDVVTDRVEARYNSVLSADAGE